MLLLGSHSFPHYGLERFFSFAKELGFEGVEITLSSNFDTRNPEYLKQLEHRFNMPIKAISLPNTGAEALIADFEKVVAEFPGMVINIAAPEMFANKYRKWVEVSLPRLVKRHRLIFNWRNAPVKTLFGVVPSRTKSTLLDLRQAGDVCLDLAAVWKNQQDIMRAASFLAEKMQHVYLSNVNHGVMYTSLTVGLLPVESFLTKLARENYRGLFTLQIAPKNMHEGDDEAMLKTLRESKDLFEKYFR
ncbi:hypothetical protein CSB37_03300 [bacterium DOLZORAL124_38_8]|nr:MAG: hypothetical protein CSB37_03300 [bacterium DOLZORAL124_38_8]